nr:hypothetical protein [Planctomycetales bacterium]
GQVELKYQWKDGQWHGEWISYDKQGNVTKRGVYKNGKHISGDDWGPSCKLPPSPQ